METGIDIDEMDMGEFRGTDAATPTGSPMPPSMDSDYFQHQTELYTIQFRTRIKKFIAAQPLSYGLTIALINVVDTFFDPNVLFASLKDAKDQEISEISLELALNQARMSSTTPDGKRTALPLIETNIKAEFYHYISRANQSRGTTERTWQGKYTIANEQRLTHVLNEEKQRKRGWFT